MKVFIHLSRHNLAKCRQFGKTNAYALAGVEESANNKKQYLLTYLKQFSICHRLRMRKAFFLPIENRQINR